MKDTRREKKNPMICSSFPTRVSVFIYGGMDLPGGIQSIVIRQLALARKSNQVAFVACKATTCLADVPSSSRLDIDQDPSHLLEQIGSRLPGKKLHLDIVALSPGAATIGFFLQTEALKKRHVHTALLCLTILHPRDLMRETERWYVHQMNRILAHAIGLQNLVFMNKECRATHSVFLSRNLYSNSIIPAPIDERQPCWAGSSDNGPLRIVCIGRLVNFKAYNFALPRIIAEFAEDRQSVTCDIFGYGAEEVKLSDLIKQYGVSDLVRLNGAIPLEKFDDIVSGYDLFIGMGTAAVQAAQLGVPTILAIIDDEHGAHGFIYSAPFGNLGEKDPSTTRQDLKMLIETYLKAGPDERTRISLDGIRYANRYVTENYVEQLTQYSVSREGLSRQVAMLYCRFYLWINDENWLRKTVRLLSGRHASGRIT
jgi:hypothetical protein